MYLQMDGGNLLHLRLSPDVDPLRGEHGEGAKDLPRHRRPEGARMSIKHYRRM